MNPLAAALLLALPATETPREMRGLWVVRTALTSPESIDRVVEQAADAGFNALFVQVRGRGDALYASRLVPRSPLLEKQPATFDPLAHLIARARERRLEVHAWINVLLAAGFQWLPAGHLVVQHPDWVMVPKQTALQALRPGAPTLALVKAAARSDPDVEGYYLSPASAAVRQYLVAVVRELVGGYPLDGLHFDFIRYPNRDYDYSRSALQAFAARQGEREPLRAALASPPAYSEWRREALTALLLALVDAARSERKPLLLSGAVVPDEATAASQKHQDWPAWASRGMLDAVVPMAYTPDDRVYREQLARALILAGPRLLWAGVGAYRLTLDATIERIGEARAAGAAGIVVFSHESFQEADFKRLREQAFARGVAASRPAEGSVSTR